MLMVVVSGMQEMLVIATQQEKEIKGMQTRKEETDCVFRRHSLYRNHQVAQEKGIRKLVREQRADEYRFGCAEINTISIH